MLNAVCRECGTTNRVGARFCKHCGAIPLHPCQACGANPRRFGSRFCWRCGLALVVQAVAPRLARA
jgi:predicted amidophosphoribosyltransferase